MTDLGDDAPRVFLAEELLFLGGQQDLFDPVGPGQDEDVDQVQIDQIAQLVVDFLDVDFDDQVSDAGILEKIFVLIFHFC